MKNFIRPDALTEEIEEAQKKRDVYLVAPEKKSKDIILCGTNNDLFYS